jgi:hypothetical protein
MAHRIVAPSSRAFASIAICSRAPRTGDHPAQEGVERGAQLLAPWRERVLDSGRDLRMDDTTQDAVAFELAQLLREHLL